ncbi:hypothetical protein TKK_0006379 [Trichogramma kaykai]|uniref:Ribosomal RNA-processing protein 14/surfeit locus protein 6 C-terminal domain-containing protein n=1 Tax=Trichogramma kaykai TaxID=54128 RepID=A0ABD2XE45_9HYME
MKIDKKLDFKTLKKQLAEEDAFISNIFSKMPIPGAELAVQNGHEEDFPFEGSDEESEEKPNNNHNDVKDKKVDRAQTIQELRGKLEDMKNKVLVHKDKLLKKGLKKKIKKQEKLAQRKLARLEAASAKKTVSIKEENGIEEEVPKPASKPKPIFNAQGNMVFSKFDFQEFGSEKKSNKGEKDPKKILKKIEETKNKVKELEKAGEIGKAQEIKEKMAWQSALAKASGEKVKDDPELLKKTIKRKEHQKKSSAKKWEARKEAVERGIQQRQDTRKENIMKRKKDVKMGKMKKAAKRGRVIPGF